MRGGNIFVDLSLFVLLYNSNIMNKIKFTDFVKNKKQKHIIVLYVQIFDNLQNPPTFRSEERLVNLIRRSEYFVGLSSSDFMGLIYLFNGYCFFLRINKKNHLICYSVTSQGGEDELHQRKNKMFKRKKIIIIIIIIIIMSAGHTHATTVVATT